MRLYALGDLHLGYEANKRALEALAPHPDDGLILAGDVGETPAHLTLAFEAATKNFRHVFWVPGNHELYTLGAATLRGRAKYDECVALARAHGVLTPEDPFFRWEGPGGPVLVALVFTLYDYSFRPPEVSLEGALRWAEERDTVATDEFLLHPDPHASRPAWCAERVARSEARLAAARAATGGLPLVLVNHWPLREDLVHIPRVPRFTLWCGTRATRDWHTRFGARVVVSGHLHVRRTDWRDGVRFEECSLGYPPQWEDARKAGKDINAMLREILPGPPPPESGTAETQWRRYG
ncbi:metallophosphoesterase-like protein [Xylariomycetidae sp. FL0641]|nr:metallophosphoesterase-like protein [Xylariomycetidae sp. FL0641]